MYLGATWLQEQRRSALPVKDKITDPEVAVAHLILVRDGLLSLNEFFQRTRHIPNRYIKYYSKSLGYDECRQIAYESYLEAIRNYPIGNKANFFAWSGMTIFRNLVEEIRRNSRLDRIRLKAAAAYEPLLSEAPDPEETFFAAELPRAIDLELGKLGYIYRESVQRHLLGGDSSESYFKSRRHAQEALAILGRSKSLRDYYE